MDTKFKPINLLIGVLLLILFYFITTRISQKKAEQINMEYPRLLRSDSLDNIVKFKYIPEDFGYSAIIVNIVLDNGNKCTIAANINPKYSTNRGTPGINGIIEAGDRIIKRSGNDTVFIFKNDLSGSPPYYFILIKNTSPK